jgi:hypothetical protein
MNYYQSLNDLVKSASKVITDIITRGGGKVNLLKKKDKLVLRIPGIITPLRLIEILKQENIIIFNFINEKDNKEVVYIEGNDLNLYDLMRIADYLTSK